MSIRKTALSSFHTMPRNAAQPLVPQCVETHAKRDFGVVPGAGERRGTYRFQRATRGHGLDALPVLTSASRMGRSPNRIVNQLKNFFDGQPGGVNNPRSLSHPVLSVGILRP